ncbi:outer membrane beta-barrel protein [Rhizobium sp. YJ-22]|uniref:outer membrane beta-barrel protein n=1 Tax=Rhizobium sp. YJ-22 TaxID=3037556 RepID=UPI0024126EEE|nr:outer membrane beta-barrel protein [Rhizobium sp. YJ-22]MDG3578770.1 outer membrane beta-barrel protein [Rhizobium sp. YJ-22]
MTRRMPSCRPISLGVALAATALFVLPSLSSAQSRPKPKTPENAARTLPQQAATPGATNAADPYGMNTDGADNDPNAATSPLFTTDAARPAQGLRTRPTANAAGNAEDTLATGTNPRARRLSGREDEQADVDFNRMNLRENSLDALTPRLIPNRNDAPGIRLGTMVLRPSVTQSVAAERQKSGSNTQNRNYLQTELKGTLASDWSRHALTVTGDGIYQRNISGDGEEKPSVNIDADLRLDLAERMTGHIRGGYGFYREDTDDPNAISGATTQAGVHTLKGGLELQREFGVIRGTTGLDLEKRIYTDATLADGSKVSLEDRDRLSGTLRGRIGYELSPAIIPFLEAAVGRARYDLRTDSLGYARSFWTYAMKGGVELDMGEKLRGELSAGYERADFDDERLQALSGLTVDGTLAWSPQRGTDVTFGLATTIEPSTTAGASGYVAYTANAGISHEVRDNVVARLTGSTVFRDYPNGSVQDETVYTAGPGFTWGLNRYLDLKGDLGYELTSRKVSDDTRTLRASIGLTLKR